ncbi:MAG: OsmC family protein [Balneolaceae bacterium]
MTSEKKKIIHIHHGKENHKTIMTAGSHELTADEPVPAGGTNKGPDPYDYLLMSLGSCSAITMKMYADRKNWPVEDIYIELRHHKSHAEDCAECEKPNARIDHIEKEIILVGDLSAEQVQKLLDISAKCPVHKTLSQKLEITSLVEKRG